MEKKKITVIGSGVAGLSSASYLAKSGHDVTLIEKNSTIGGRARSFKVDGFFFDMGPSWYWMPDVFERFYNDFGYTTKDFYELKRLDPSYRVFWKDDSKDDYHAFKGNAYGLANTLSQTAFLKPKITNKNIKNLFYTGQLTTPGPGVPPSIISGEVVAKEINKRIHAKKL